MTSSEREGRNSVPQRRRETKKRRAGWKEWKDVGRGEGRVGTGLIPGRTIWDLRGKRMSSDGHLDDETEKHFSGT